MDSTNCTRGSIGKSPRRKINALYRIGRKLRPSKMDVLVVSPTKSGVKNVVFNIVMTETWKRTETTHLTLPIHDTPESCDQVSLLNERLLRSLEPWQPLYLIYGVLFFWVRAYIYLWRHHGEYDVIWLHTPRLLPLLPKHVSSHAVLTYHSPLNLDKVGAHTSVRRAYYLLFGWIEKFGLRRHRHATFTAISQEIVQSLQDNGVPEASTHPVLNAVDLEQFSPGDGDGPFRDKWSDGERPVILYVGRLAPEKGPDQLLEVANVFETNTPDSTSPQFVLVGDGPIREKLESFVERHNLENVQIEGYIDHEDVADAYRSADYFVLPSRWEGASLSLLEALACGLPAYVSNLDTLSYVADTEFVTLVPFEDPETTASILRADIDDEHDWQALSSQARTFVEKHFNWEQQAERYLTLFEISSS